MTGSVLFVAFVSVVSVVLFVVGGGEEFTIW